MQYLHYCQVSAGSIWSQFSDLKDPQVSALWTLKLFIGRAIAEAVSRWLPTAAAHVQSRVWSSGICGGQSGAGAGFL
jgi:hypothetical protein